MPSILKGKLAPNLKPFRDDGRASSCAAESVGSNSKK
jgi:hypothetical protein